MASPCEMPAGVGGFISFHIRWNTEYFTMTAGHYFTSEGYFTFIKAVILLETVLYEFGFDWLKAIGQCSILLIGICFFFGSRMIRTSSDTHSINDKSINPQAIKHILRSIGIFCGVVFAVFFTAHVREYYEYNNILKNGDFLTVEGYVENYDPLLWYEKDAECFEINGVYFEYFDAGTNGYQTTAKRGGVITENGQHLKIKYITNQNGENVILYIAEI